MKKALLILSLIQSTFIFNAQGLSFDWAKSMGSTSNDASSRIAIDATGNVYTAGFFQGVADFDPGPGITNLTSQGNQDIYISKLDASGNLVWARSIGNASVETANSINIDVSGNVLVTGYFYGTIDSDPGIGVSNLTALGSSDCFILKLDANGNFVWAKNIGGTTFDFGGTINTDALGNVYTGGQFSGTVDFNPSPAVFNITESGSSDGFILKLDVAGNFVWAKKFGGNQTEGINSIKLDVAGNIYSTGGFYGTCDFDPGPGISNLSSFGQSDAFVVKLDPSGAFLWAKNLGATFNDFGSSITIDTNGNIYSIGSYQGSADMDPGPGNATLNSVFFYDCYISKLDANGNYVWGKGFGGTGADHGYGIGLDASNNVYATGCFNDLVDFNPGNGIDTLNANGASNVFILELDALGNFIWAKNIGDTPSNQGQDLCLDAVGNVYVTGNSSGTTDFDPGLGTYTMSSVGAEDIFVLKLNPCLAPAAPTNTTPFINQNICEGNSTNLQALSLGTVNWFAGPTSTLVLGTGTLFTTPVLSPGTYTFYAEASTCATSLLRTAITVTVNQCVGIQEKFNAEDLFSLNLFPNPSNGELTISTNIEGQFLIINSLGQTISNISILSANNYKSNIKGLTSGVYYLIDKNNKQTIKQKIVVFR